LLLLLPVAVAAQGLPTAKPEDVGVSSQKVEELSKFMQSLVDDGKIAGGVTMMARHGKVIHLKAVGMADREEKRPMRTDSIFRIASMTKPVTSVAIMMLHEEGKLDLDDPVSKYIPEFKNPKVLVSVDPLETRPAKREITIRHLLTHTSGLGYTSTDTLGPMYSAHGIVHGICRTDMTMEQLIRRVAQLPLKFHPGERWEYGMSTDVLGRVVEVVSAETLDRFIEDHICRPLGMTDTFFLSPPDKRQRLVAVYVPQNGHIRKLQKGEIVDHQKSRISSDYHLDSNKCRSGGGDLCSTAADYMRFCQVLLNGGQLDGIRLLREDTVKIMTTNQVGELKRDEGFGLGFGVKPNTDDVHVQLRSSYNWGGFWSTSFRISPRGDWIVVTMAQRAWTNDASPVWTAKYETIAAEAIEK
jgi:CubicO group peptidase (beta-lactamase class C family)